MCGVTVYVFFKDGIKDVFLAFEVVVKSAPGFARFRGDIFNACMLKPVAGEDRPGRAQKFLARKQRTFLPENR